MKLSDIFIFATLLTICFSDKSQYKGILNLLNGSEKTTAKPIVVIPISQEPKIVNIRGNIVRLIKASPFDACEAIKPFDSNIKDSVVLLIDARMKSCTPMRKIFTARQTMAKGVILITNDSDRILSQSTALQDAIFFIGIAEVQDVTSLLAETQDIMASISIHSAGARENEVEIWISSLNEHSYNVLEMWHHTLERIPILKSKAKWNPRFAMLGCSDENIKTMRICQQQNYVVSCACKGKFCSPQFHGQAPNVLVKEDIRQRLIFQQYPELFLEYILLFKEKCFEGYQTTMFAESCAYTTMEYFKIDGETINLQIDQFLRDCTSDEDPTQLFKIINHDSNSFRKYNSFPLILLNKEEIVIQNEFQLQNSLCRLLSIQKEQGCVFVSKSMTITKIVLSVVFFVVIVALLIGLGASIIICYRKMLRRDMKKEVKMQVSTAVEHYFTLSEQKPQV